jgi:hypothetical protein
MNIIVHVANAPFTNLVCGIIMVTTWLLIHKYIVLKAWFWYDKKKIEKEALNT